MIKIITIPFDRKIKGFDEEVLNRFMLNIRVIDIESRFFEDRGEKYWSVLLRYEVPLDHDSNRTAPAAQLNETQQLLFEGLRQWRKERADKDGIPVFIIGTNRELTDIAVKAPKSLEGLGAIKGFGKGKVKKYGRQIVDIVKGFYDKS
jgi:superfamily II DNA helicase RecQ